MIGKVVYYLDFDKDNPNIYQATIVNEFISDLGYIKYNMVTEDGFASKEAQYVFESYDLAKEEFDKLLPLSQEMYRIVEEAQKKCDEIREKMVGKPDAKLVELAKLVNKLRG